MLVLAIVINVLKYILSLLTLVVMVAVLAQIQVSFHDWRCWLRRTPEFSEWFFIWSYLTILTVALWIASMGM